MMSFIVAALFFGFFTGYGLRDNIADDQLTRAEEQCDKRLTSKPCSPFTFPDNDHNYIPAPMPVHPIELEPCDENRSQLCIKLPPGMTGVTVPNLEIK